MPYPPGGCTAPVSSSQITVAVSPAITDDGYELHSTWINTVLDTAWIMTDNSPGAAVWAPI